MHKIECQTAHTNGSQGIDVSVKENCCWHYLAAVDFNLPK